MPTISALALLLGLIQTVEPHLSQGADSPAGASAISGRLIDGVSKLPLGGVKIRILTVAGKNAQVVTDDEGRYQFAGIPAGKHRFAIERADYFLVTTDGSPIAPFTAAPVAVAAGDHAEGVDFIMKRGAAIRGVITDDAGEPIANAVVTAMLVGSPPVWFRAAQTDERGAYDITGLPNGNFTIDAIHQRYERVFYPGVASARDATQIGVSSGDQIRGLNIIASGTTPRVSGRIVSFNDVIPASLELFAESSPAKSRIGRPVKDGRFSFVSLKRGRYVIWARGRFGDEIHASAQAVHVGDAAADIELMLAPTGEIEGRVVTETGEPLPSDHLGVAALLADGQTAVQFSSPDQSDVREDGTFSLRGLFGDRILRLERLPSPWMIKKIVNGRREVSPPHVTITPGLITSIQIVIGR